MSINLHKGDRINLAKEAPSMKKSGVGLAWDINATDTGKDFDLDVSVFMLGENGKIPNERFFVFYNIATARVVRTLALVHTPSHLADS